MSVVRVWMEGQNMSIRAVRAAVAAAILASGRSLALPAVQSINSFVTTCNPGSKHQLVFTTLLCAAQKGLGRVELHDYITSTLVLDGLHRAKLYLKSRGVPDETINAISAALQWGEPQGVNYETGRRTNKMDGGVTVR